MEAILSGLKIDPENREVAKTLRYFQGLGNFKNERFRSATENFTEALKLDENNINLFMLRAKSYANLTLHDEVIIDLMEAETLNKKDENRKISNEIKRMRKVVGSSYIPKTNYELLEVPRTAGDSEIILAYNSQSILYKVNLSKASTEAEKRKLTFFYRRIEISFQILSNKKTREKYDKILAAQESSIECPTVEAYCKSCGKCCTVCGSAFGNCLNGFFTGIGNCFTGLGKCISGSCCSSDGLAIICRSLNLCNILIAFIVLLFLWWILN